ncbi:MAG: hypothetical protein MUC67_05725 [Acidobacteria bacterium]|nr:hypothetical protein [Acidobacteriota bacterium]MCU0253831.1 hypothetical protein [Acidobacteriota bacterium]
MSRFSSLIRNLAKAAVLTGLVIGVAACATTTQKTGDDSGRETFRARIVNLGGVLPSGTNTLWLTIDSWSTDEEVETLRRGLEQGGQQGLTDALATMEKGFVRIGSSLRWPISHALSVDTPQGRKVRAVTRRPITFVETAVSARSADYSVGIVEFVIPPGKMGEGVLIPAAQVTIEGKEIVVTTPPRNIAPMQLQNVELRGN